MAHLRFIQGVLGIADNRRTLAAIQGARGHLKYSDSANFLGKECSKEEPSVNIAAQQASDSARKWTSGLGLGISGLFFLALKPG